MTTRIHIHLSRRRQRGATMVSVMLLTVSLMTLGLLVVRSSTREVTQAGQLVARERALMAAQAALDLATAQYVDMNPASLDSALVGSLPQGATCSDPCGDCIPDANVIATGQRNEILAGGANVSCGGRPCMRQGAVTLLRDASGADTHWCDVPLRELLAAGDPEARVSTWIRNNSGDALGGAAGAGSWTDDADGRVVVTAMATVRGATVALEQEVLLSFANGPQAMLPQSPDEGYGGGHNNDNSAVSVCVDDYAVAAAN
jgi:Tfp pilus assembly protein PilX